MKNHKTTNDSKTTENRKNNKHSIGIFRIFGKFFDVALTVFKNNNILLNKISHWFLGTSACGCSLSLSLFLSLCVHVCVYYDLYEYDPKIESGEKESILEKNVVF